MRAGRRIGRPTFLPDLWNQHSAALQGEPRTNNLVEGWHRRFNTLVGKSHPSLYTLLKEIQKEQGNTERRINELELAKVKQRISKEKKNYIARTCSVVLLAIRWCKPPKVSSIAR